MDASPVLPNRRWPRLGWLRHTLTSSCRTATGMLRPALFMRISPSQLDRHVRRRVESDIGPFSEKIAQTAAADVPVTAEVNKDEGKLRLPEGSLKAPRADANCLLTGDSCMVGRTKRSVGGMTNQYPCGHVLP